MLERLTGRGKLVPHVPFRTHGASPGERAELEDHGCPAPTGGKGRSADRAAPVSLSSLYGLHGLRAALLCRSDRFPVATRSLQPQKPKRPGVTLLVFLQVSPASACRGGPVCPKAPRQTLFWLREHLSGAQGTRPASLRKGNCFAVPAAPRRLLLTSSCGSCWAAESQSHRFCCARTLLGANSPRSAEPAALYT